jgi:hypothetical protein
MAIPAGAVYNTGDLGGHTRLYLDRIGFADSGVLALDADKLHQCQPCQRQCTHISELESSMNSVQIEQKSYEMPPREGFTVAHFLTVADIDRSARFYALRYAQRIFSGSN